MMSALAQGAELSPDGKSLTVRLPLTLRKKGGRKIIISPAGEQLVLQPWGMPSSGIDEGLLKALAQAFQWQQMLDDGQYATVGDLAKSRNLDQSFVSRILRLTLLAPDIVEAILDGTQAPGCGQAASGKKAIYSGHSGNVRMLCSARTRIGAQLKAELRILRCILSGL